MGPTLCVNTSGPSEEGDNQRYKASNKISYWPHKGKGLPAFAFPAAAGTHLAYRDHGEMEGWEDFGAK